MTNLEEIDHFKMLLIFKFGDRYRFDLIKSNSDNDNHPNQQFCVAFEYTSPHKLDLRNLIPTYGGTDWFNTELEAWRAAWYTL